MLKLNVLYEQGGKKEFSFSQKNIRIGRGEKNEICLNDDLRVSTEHCILTIKNESIFLKDLNSRNGTYINEENIGKKEIEVYPKDKIRVGRTFIQVLQENSDLVCDAKTADIKTEDENNDSENTSILKNIDNLTAGLTLLKTMADKSNEAGEIDKIKECEKKFSNQIEKLQTDIRDTQKILERYLALNKAAQTINSCLDLNVQLQRILEEAMILMDAQEGFLISYNKETKVKNVEALKQIDHMKKYQPFFSNDVVSQCLSRGRPILLGEAYSSKDFSSSQSILNIASILCVPIRFADEILGVIYLDDKKNLNKFDTNDQDLLLTFASHCAVAMKNAKLIENVKKNERRMAGLQRFLPMNLAMQVVDSTVFINLGGEKRVCTTMFTDIRGFSAIAEKLNPHEIVNLLNEYFSAMVKIIFKYQGTLDKFLGDGIMAVFGAPISIGDDALAAVKTAIEMQEAVRSLNFKKGDEARITFEIGIGIDTGEAIAGNIGSEQRMEYTVIGNPVNISSRLCGVAKAGQILISEQTYERIKKGDKNFKVKSSGHRKLKNISQEINTYEIDYSFI